MTHHEISRILAGTFLVCVSYVFLIDICEEMGSEFALKLKWSLSWTLARYIGGISGTLLALDVFF